MMVRCKEEEKEKKKCKFFFFFKQKTAYEIYQCDWSSDVCSSDLNRFKDGDKITPKILLDKKLVDNIKSGVKILSNGRIKVGITISGCSLSKTAKTAIEKAGGKVL